MTKPENVALRAGHASSAFTVAASSTGRRQSPLAVASSKALPQHARAHNRSLVLNTLFRAGAMSRAQLARASSLTRPTVSQLIADLMAEGLVVEVPTSASAVGKPGTPVDIDASGWCILAADLSSSDVIHGTVRDLRGRELHRRQVQLNQARGEQAVTAVIRLLDKLSASADRPILGIGVGSPGIVDGAGIVVQAARLGWRDLPLGGRLTERFGVPALITNDANAAALGLHADPALRSHSLLAITVEQGLGIGLVLDGVLVAGERFCAGEIGHLTIDPDGPWCECGRRGCLEGLFPADPVDGQAWLQDRGPYAAGVLAGVLAPVVAAVNVTRVVFSGREGIVADPFPKLVEDSVRERIPAAVISDFQISGAGPSRDLVLRGATALVLAARLGVV